MKSNKAAAIIQARMGSTRLPGKVMKDLLGKPVLWHDIQRIKQSELIDEIIIATTTKKQDQVIYEKALEWGVKAFRGSEEDVLKRYYDAAAENGVDTVVRITSDCPLIDPHVIDEIVEYYNVHDYTLVTNAGSDLKNRTYPRGFDTEVFSFNVLEEAFNKAEERYQREHVTPFIYENPDSSFSMEPAEFKKMVDDIRAAEKAIGKVDYSVSEKEKESRIFRRSIFVTKDIEAGEELTEENIKIIRPGYGLKPEHWDKALKSKAINDIKKGTPLKWDMIK